MADAPAPGWVSAPEDASVGVEVGGVVAVGLGVGVASPPPHAATRAIMRGPNSSADKGLRISIKVDPILWTGIEAC